jgi:starch phosphorylase
MHHVEPFLSRTRIAHFSMEIALRPEIHTYSGGLGVLAGDTARSAADLGLPMVFVSLVSRAGYVLQEIDGEGRQTAKPNPWRPDEWAQPLGAMIAVPIEGREVWLRAWLYELSSPLGRSVPVLLLDTDLDQNNPSDREITHYLYGGDDAYRLKQEIVLGIGGATMLRALGFQIETYHLNEGHAALLTLSLLRPCRRPKEDIIPGEPLYDHMRVRRHCVFTTHTPVEAGLDKFDYALVQRILDDYIELDELKLLGGQDRLNMTRLALNLSGFVNGVSERHAETTSHIFPGYRVRSITNGVHPATWTHARFAQLFGTHLPQWAYEPEVLTRVDQLSDDAIWSAHQDAKQELLTTIKERTGVAMRLDVPLLGFARRMTQYKRPDLLFEDVDRLRAIAQKRPFQLAFAGLAHTRDQAGVALISSLHDRMRELASDIPIAFIPNYDMQVAARMVAGVDVWLNTPLPPFEASGTSGMKAAMNGVLNLSVLDGWWIEANIEGVNGWAIGMGEANDAGAHANDLYRQLEDAVLPLYRSDRTRWIWMMKQAISKIASYFNSQRMMRRYATEAYIGDIGEG